MMENPSANRPFPRPRCRVLVGLGGPHLEQAILPALQETDDLAIERTLTGAHLLDRAHQTGPDAVIVASDLPGLEPALLAELRRAGIPAVILASGGVAGRWSGSGVVLPTDAGTDQIRAALDRALRGEAPRWQGVAQDLPSPEPQAQQPDGEITTIAVASGAGSPGRTTVALGIAAALGSVARTVLVDADLDGPSLAAHLDADPTRNLFMLVHGDPREPGDWDRALDQELQPLDPRSPQGTVLCGVPKPAMRADVTPPRFERAVAELRVRHRYVVIDIGADLLGAEATIHRAALRIADQILLVGTADIVGLSRLRAALELCRSRLDVDPAHIALVVNRHDRRRHHRRAEIEWALGAPLATLVPYDHTGIQRALAAQRPATLVGRSAAGRALFSLAERAHDGRIAVAPEPRAVSRWWRLGSPDRRATPGDEIAASTDTRRPQRSRSAWPWQARAATRSPIESGGSELAPRPSIVPVDRGDKRHRSRRKDRA